MVLAIDIMDWHGLNNEVHCSPRPIMLKILPIMLLSSAQKIAHYAQYYAHKY